MLSLRDFPFFLPEDVGGPIVSPPPVVAQFGEVAFAIIEASDTGSILVDPNDLELLDSETDEDLIQ